MKTLFACSMVLLTVASTLAAEPTTNRQLTARERLKPGEFRQKLQAYYGGPVIREGVSKGWIAFANAQGVLPEAKVRTAVENLRMSMRLEMSVVKPSGRVDVKTAGALAAKIGANATVFLTEDDELPPTLIAADSAWAIVNAKPLAADVPAGIAQERVRKAMIRAFALLCGAADAGNAGSMMWPVRKNEDLDAIQMPMRLPPTLVAPIGNHMCRTGMRPFEVLSYRKACEAGWAKPPTNDVQKVIWDQVHAIPKEPLKIKFDPKTRK